MDSSSVPPQLGVVWAAAASGSFKRTVPVPSQIGITAGAASWTDGFPPLTAADRLTAGGGAPGIKDFNGALNEFSTIIQALQAGMLPRYDSTFSADVGGYPKNAVLRGTNGIHQWRSTVENNTTDPDGGSPSGWVDESVFGINVAVVTSISALRAVDKTVYSKTLVTGYSTHGDGVLSTYALRASGSATDDGGSVIIASDGGIWDLVVDGFSVVDRQFGVKADGSTDDTTAHQNAINYVLKNSDPATYLPNSPYSPPAILEYGSGYTVITAPLIETNKIAHHGAGAAERSSGTRIFQQTTNAD